MLSRFITKSSNFRFLTLIPSHSPLHNLRPPIPISNPVCFSDKIPRFYSTNGGDKNDHHLWNLASEADDSADSLFGEEQPGAPVGPMEAAQKLDPESLNGGGNADDLFGDPVAPASPREAAQIWDPEALNGGGGADDLFGDPVSPASPREESQKWDLESLNGSGGGDDLFVEVTGEERPVAEEHEQWNLDGEEALNGGGGADDLFGDPVAPASPREEAQKWDLESLNGSGGGDDLFVEVTGEERPMAEEHKQWNLDGEEALNGGGGADDLFGDPVAPASPRDEAQKWDLDSLNGSGGGDDLFVEETEEWRPTAEEQWNLGGEEDVELDLFKGVDLPQQDDLEELRLKNAAAQAEEEKKKKLLEAEEKILTEIVKGPKHAFGDLIAASGITDEMLDTLLALKDFGGIPGLRPLQELEDERYLKNTTKSTKAEIERLKQEEVAKARVQNIDAKGRAYGTGRRKCSVARVYIQPGEGKFTVNDKEFDVYFPMIEHRAVLLRPFSETKTLGKWNVKCTAKGGGVSGQVGAIRLGISRALQNWAPDLRPPLRAAGLLTRDSRVVERKKPGRAKARKSFQWVKR